MSDLDGTGGGQHPMKLTQTQQGLIVDDGRVVAASLDQILQSEYPQAFVRAHLSHERSTSGAQSHAPIGYQEVWAAGDTYFRSRDARKEESQSAGGGDFYARVYN